MKAFVDTNVLLDVLLKRQGLVEASAAVWSRVAGKQLRGWISAISINNVYYITRKAAGADAAREAVLTVRETFDVVPLDLGVVDAALAAAMADFEDAIQYASALQAGAQCMVTRNTRDFPSTGIPVLTPEQFLAAVVVNEAAT